MKYLIIVMFFILVGCANSNCPSSKRRNYRHGDAVTITGGFYTGYKGAIIDKATYYGKACIVPAFEVKFYTNTEGWITKKISQYNLYVHEKKNESEE